MPTETLKNYAKESGKSIEEVEKAWEESKLEANKYFKEGEKDPNYWGYVNMRTKQKLGLKNYKPKNK